MKYSLKVIFLCVACTFCTSMVMAETELVSLFREGLTIYKTDPAKGAGMVETAILQSMLEPTQFADIWKVYETSEALKSAENIKKIEMLGVFLDCVQKTSRNCKTRSEFNEIWTIQKNIQDLRVQAINEICNSARTALENLEIEAILEHLEMLDILLEYTGESNIENSHFLQGISDKLTNKIGMYEKRFEKLKEEADNVNWDDISEQLSREPVTFTDGETTCLSKEIQDYLSIFQIPEVSTIIERFPPSENPLERGEKLLEKVQTLNRVRYNLWANWALYNFGENTAAVDVLSRISPEYLYTPVEILFHEKQEILFQKLRNPAILSDALQRFILEEKVPLNAF